MKSWKIATASLFVILLTVPAVLGLIPLSVQTPIGALSLEAGEAEARNRNTSRNRLRGIRIHTRGASFTQNFSPTRHRYTVNLHQDTARISLQPTRGSGMNQQIRTRIDTRRASGTWRNGNWTRWRQASNRINIDVSRGQERRVRIAVRDTNRNVRTYTVNVRRASPNTWGASLRANAGTFNRSFARNVTNYTLTIPTNRASVNVRMTSEGSRASVRTRVNNGNWSASSQGARSRTVNVPEGGTRTLQFRIRGAFSSAAPSPTRDRIYTITINRTGAPESVDPIATPSFTFDGSGWGHGLGMSQNGAMQMAREGRNFSQILNHYFTGITIANRAPQGNMRVNLDANRSNRTSWRIGPRDGQAGSTMTIGGRNFNGANAPYTFSVSGGNVRMRDRHGTTTNFGNQVRITGSGGLLTVLDRSGPPLPTAAHQNVRYRGTLELTVVSGRLRLVNELSMQRYLYGVVPREIPTSERVRTAVEAQAIAARSFAHGHTMNSTGVSNKHGFQVYGGHSRFSSEARWRAGTPVTNLENPISNAAVDSTGNRVVLFNGNIVRAFYSACNADRTANSEDVWVARLGHLRSVADSFCGRSGHAGHNWSVTMTGLQLARTLRDRGASVPRGAGSTVFVESLRLDRATGGWVRTLTVNWSDGTTTRIGNADNVRIRLGLRSSNFSVSTFTASTATSADLPAASIGTTGANMTPLDAALAGFEAPAGHSIESLSLEETITELIEAGYDDMFLTQEKRSFEDVCDGGPIVDENGETRLHETCE